MLNQAPKPPYGKKVLTDVERPLEDLARDFQQWLEGQISIRNRGPFDFTVKEQIRNKEVIGYDIVYIGPSENVVIGKLRATGQNQVDLIIRSHRLTRNVRITQYSPSNYGER